MKLRTPALLVLVIAVLLAAGCGSSSKTSAKSGSSDTTTATSQGSGSDTTTAAASSDTTANTNSSGSNKVALSSLSGKCKQLALLGAKYSAAAQSLGNAMTTGGDLGAQMSKAAQLMAVYAAQTPSEIRSDFKTFADAMKSLADDLKGVTFKPGQQPSAADMAKLTKAGQAFNAAKFKTAAAHITAWTQKNCGSGFGQ